MTDLDLKEYINTCIHLGSYHELIQGSGGNFSVKNDDYIIIKSSGRVLAETTQHSGYVKCSIKMLKECMHDSSLPIESAVCGGDKGKPSMEVFFHLLPHKWVIHVHPIAFLVHLCKKSWTSLQSSYQCSYIPYHIPGTDLGLYILENYKGEQVLFLKNHGVIVCGSSRDEVYMILDDLYTVNKLSKLNNEFTESYKLKEYIESYAAQESIVLKPCRSRQPFYSRLFLPITPDISLFLKHSPMVQEHASECAKKLFDSYFTMFKTIPSVIKLMNTVYVCGKSYHQCVMIEEILDSYLEIIEHGSDLDFFDDKTLKNISSSESEIYRMSLK